MSVCTKWDMFCVRCFHGVCNRVFGRCVTQIYFFIVCAVCNALLAVPDDWVYFKLGAGSVGVGAVSGTFSAMFTFTSELFPTVARTMAVGVTSMACQIGSMLAPFVAGFVTAAPLAPPTIFALAPLIAATAYQKLKALSSLTI